MRGAVRRLLKGLPREPVNSISARFGASVIPWDFVDLIDRDPARRVRLRVEQDRLSKMHPSDIADILEELAPAERQALFISLDEEVAAEALEEVKPKMQQSLIESLDSEQVAGIVEEMDPGAAADLLSELPDERSEAILEEMDPEERQDVEDLLEFSGNSAAGRMTTEYVALPAAAIVDQAIKPCATSKATSRPSPISTCSTKRNESPALSPSFESCLRSPRCRSPTSRKDTSSAATSTPMAAKWPNSSTNTTSALFLSSTTKDVSSGSSTLNRSSPFCEPDVKALQVCRKGRPPTFCLKRQGRYHQGRLKGNAAFHEDSVRRRPLTQGIVPLSSLGTRAPRPSGHTLQHLRLSASKSTRQQGRPSPLRRPLRQSA